jgi:hypothetical protein
MMWLYIVEAIVTVGCVAYGILGDTYEDPDW